jgi:MFS-type transporter involved in bile tolerance (Atg22 family)
VVKQLLLQSSNTDQRNAAYVVFETVWTAAFSIIVTFSTIYAIRLGATNTEVGLLTSMPALLTILISIPMGKFLESRPKPSRWTFASLFTQRIVYLSLALVPWIPFLEDRQGTAVVVLIILASIPGQIFNIGIWPYYMNIISPNRRAAVFSTQSIITSLVVGTGTVLVGLFLESKTFPSNYQVMITIGILVSMTSFYCFSQVKEPARNTELASATVPDQGTVSPKNLRSLLHMHSDYGRIIFNQVFQYIGVWTATPLITIYTIKILQASDSWVGKNTSIIFFCQLIGWLIARRLIGLKGETVILKRTAAFPVFQTLLIGLSTSLTPILFANGLHGLLAPSYSLSHNNVLLKSIPAGKEHEGIAMYATINRIGIFICPFIGLALAEWIGDIRVVILACGILSLLGSLSFSIWPVSLNANKVY